MLKEIQFVGGSIPGTDHTMPGQPKWVNNHDSFIIQPSDHCVVAIVCDGCGTGKHSEVGAKLGSILLARAIVSQAERILSSRPLADLGADVFWERITRMVVGQLTGTICAMGDSLTDIVREHFLFTVVGTLITDSAVLVFSLGDGMYAINGKMYDLGPFPNNEPPYLMYALTGSTREGSASNRLFVNHMITAENFQSVLIGTDGLSWLISASDMQIPGREEKVGPISQFWENDEYFVNDDMIRRRLAVINRERSDGKAVRGGPLKDDTTLVVIRRRPENTLETETCMSS